MSQKLTVVVLACRQAVPDPGVILTPLQGAGLAPRVISEPCSSKVEAFQMLRLLAGEADLLWVVGCPETACQLVEGSFRMAQRAAHVQEYLREIGLEAERLGWSFLPGANQEAVTAVLTEIIERARTLGANPARAGVPD